MNNNIEERVALYPATGVHAGVVDIMHAIGDYILSKFPRNYFKSTHFDTRDGFYSQYIQRKKSMLKGQVGITAQQLKPRLVIVYNHRNNDAKETGLGEVNPYIYPMTQGIHPEMRTYFPIYNDPNMIRIYTSDKRVKVEIEIICELESASDQESCCVYLENVLKVLYGERLFGINAHFILSNEMIRYIRNMLYMNNIKIASNETDKDLKKDLFAKINDNFNSYIAQYSGGTIFPYKNKDKTFYLYERTFESIYWEINSPPERSDGDKKGEIYEKFTVNCSGFFEFYKPNCYLIKSPDIVCGNLIDDIMKVSIEPNKNLENGPAGVIPYMPKRKFLPDLVTHFCSSSEFTLLFSEFEFQVDEPKDSVNIIEWFAEENDNKETYKDLLRYIKTIDERDFGLLFKVFVYEGDIPLDPEYEIIMEKEIVYLTNTDTTKLYSIFLLYNKREIETRINQMLIKEKEF